MLFYNAYHSYVYLIFGNHSIYDGQMYILVLFLNLLQEFSLIFKNITKS